MPKFWSTVIATNCLLCQSQPTVLDAPLCRGCLDDLPWLHPHHLPAIVLEHVTAYSALSYDYPINSLITAFKHQQTLEILPVLEFALQQLVLPPFDAILPVPLAPTRLAMRGYNQSLLLAKKLSKMYQKPIWQGLLRQRYTIKQQALGRSERLENLRGAFALNNLQSIKQIPKRILIVDDVLTTGSTLTEIATTLKYYGVKQVIAATVAIVK